MSQADVPQAFVYDALRTPRGKGKKNGSLHEVKPIDLVVGLLDAYGRWLLPEFSYFVLFGPMAVLLLFRPRGLAGKDA